MNKNKIVKIVTREYPNLIEKTFYSENDIALKRQSIPINSSIPDWEQVLVFSEDNKRSILGNNYNNKLDIIREDFYNEDNKIIHTVFNKPKEIQEIFYTYDNNGLLIEEKDNKLNTISEYIYDRSNRLIRQQGFNTIDYSYTGNKILKEIDNNTNITVLYGYGILTHTKTYLTIFPNGKEKLEVNKFDKFGTLIEKINNGISIIFKPEYDKKHRLQKITTNDYIETYKYNLI